MRITKKHLNAKIDTINELAGTPKKFMVDGVMQPNHYHLDWDYNQPMFVQTSANGQGVSALVQKRVPKPQMADILDSYIAALRRFA